MEMEFKKSRKLQGWKYSCLLCIPAPWLEMHNLHKGSAVKVVINKEGNLLIKPFQEVKQNETTQP